MPPTVRGWPSVVAVEAFFFLGGGGGGVISANVYKQVCNSARSGRLIEPTKNT